MVFFYSASLLLSLVVDTSWLLAKSDVTEAVADEASKLKSRANLIFLRVERCTSCSTRSRIGTGVCAKSD